MSGSTISLGLVMLGQLAANDAAVCGSEQTVDPSAITPDMDDPAEDAQIANRVR